MPKNLVAVYGTLKTGKPNHYVMELVSAQLIGEGKTVEKYPLIADGRLPYLFGQNGAGHRVAVEIYEVSDEALRVIDRFEGHPNFYERKSAKCELSSGEILDCFVYFINQKRKDFSGFRLRKNY